MPRFLHIGVMAAVLVASLGATRAPRVQAHPNVAPVRVTQLTSGAQIAAYLTRAGFHGYILLARHGRTILSKGYGRADAAHKVPNTLHTRWPMYGVGHFMIALAILKLQEEGRLHVRDKLCAYITHCPRAWRPLTLHHLLTGTSGLGAYDASGATGRIKDALASCLAVPLAGAPGALSGDTLTEDSPCNNILLSAILEKVAGEPFVTVLQTRLFHPAGMTDSRFQTSAAVPPGSARGYLHGVPAAPPPVPEIPRVYASVADLQRLDGALLAGKILSRQSQRALFSRYINNNPGGYPFYRGYGIVTVKQNTRNAQTWAFSDAGTEESGFLIDNGFSPDDGAVAIWMISDRGLFGEEAENTFGAHITQLMGGL